MPFRKPPMAVDRAEVHFEPAHKPRRPPPQATPAHLEATAAAYVQKFWGPAESLRRVLLRHVARSVEFHGTDAEQSRREVERILAHCAECGLVDDRRFAEGAVRVLRERGGSQRAIEAKLRQRGVAVPEIAAALDLARHDGVDDLTAAHAYAKRRRLGPHRPASERAERRQKDLAAMARAGFSFDLARRALDADPEADFDAN